MKNIQVVSASWCGYCRAAKGFLDKLELAFEEIDVTNDDGLRNKWSKKANNHPTIPMVFIGGVFIGGYTELVGAQKSGKLEKLLNS